MGSGCPVESQRYGGVFATQPVLFNGKAQKLGFSCFNSEQILAKFVLYAIYCDESHA